MKFIISIFLFLLFFNVQVFANSYSKIIDNIETTLYGFQYVSESDSKRLDRIENTVYGKISSGSDEQRVQKLKKDLSADLIGQEISPKEDTFEDEEILSDTNIQYPAVDELEQKIFGKINQKMGIKERLSLLENKTFGQIYDDDLSSRVDRLKAEIKPNSFMNNAIAQSDNPYYEDQVLELDRNYHLDRYESPRYFDYDTYNEMQNNKMNYSSKSTNLATVEKSVFKRSFKDEDLNSRISRVENAMFGTEFSDEDTNTRLNRISSAYKAQKSSSKYDSNKFSQNMATAIQIGTMILMVLACIL